MARIYKLVYFNVTGIGEPIRYLLSYAKFQFEDKRVEYEEYLKLKPNVPYGLLPYIEVDGKILTQSSAICRHIAKQCGLVGKSEWNGIEIDAAVDAITDFRLNYTAYFKENDVVRKAELLAAIKNTHNPYYLSRFEKLVKQNGGYFIKDQLTWADFFFAAIAELLINLIKEPVVDDYPSLKSLKEKIENLPEIKEYRANRPTTIL